MKIRYYAQLLAVAFFTLSLAFGCQSDEDDGNIVETPQEEEEDYDAVPFTVSILGSDKSNLSAQIDVQTTSINNYVVAVFSQEEYISYGSSLDASILGAITAIEDVVDFAAADNRYIFSGSQAIDLTQNWEFESDATYMLLVAGVDVNGGVITNVVGESFSTAGTGAFASEVYYTTTSDIVLWVEPDSSIANYMVGIYQLSNFEGDFNYSTTALAQYYVDYYATTYGSWSLTEVNDIVVHNGSQLISLGDWFNLLPQTTYSIVIFGIGSDGETIDTNISYLEASTEGEHQPSDAYSDWLGDWLVTSTASFSTSFTGSTTTTGSPIEFYVTISEGIHDYTYNITGWDLTMLRSSNRFRIYYSNESNEVYFWSTSFIGYGYASDPYISWMYAFGLVEGYGNDAYIISGDYPALTAVKSGDDTITATGYEGYISNNIPFNTTHLRPIIADSAGSLWAYSYDSGYSTEPIGPYTLTRVGSSSSSAPATKSEAATRSRLDVPKLESVK